MERAGEDLKREAAEDAEAVGLDEGELAAARFDLGYGLSVEAKGVSEVLLGEAVGVTPGGQASADGSGSEAGGGHGVSIPYGGRIVKEILPWGADPGIREVRDGFGGLDSPAKQRTQGPVRARSRGRRSVLSDGEVGERGDGQAVLAEDVERWRGEADVASGRDGEGDDEGSLYDRGISGQHVDGGGVPAVLAAEDPPVGGVEGAELEGLVEGEQELAGE